MAPFIQRDTRQGIESVNNNINNMEQNNKMVIYQVFPRWFGNRQSRLVKNGSKETNGVGKFSDFTPTALAQIKQLGVTHIWYTGIIEHATCTDYSAYGIRKDHPAAVKGEAGSPYAIKDYYDVDPDLADNVPERMREFEALIKRTHNAGLKLIIDFVPNHVARQYRSDAQPPFERDLGETDDTAQAFSPSNNFYYLPGQVLQLPVGSKPGEQPYSELPAKVTGNDCFTASPGINDWYETVKLNYGIDYLNGRSRHFDPVPDTWKKMLEILLFWADKDVDGFRCDMAEMVPVEFWNWAIPKVKRERSLCFIAEVYNPAEYRNYLQIGHFDYLYDKVGLYDTLRAVMCGQAPACRITSCWQATNDIQEHMLNFLENHDEQRIASSFFAGSPEPGIAGMLVSALMHTNPIMIYSGQELGEPGMDEEGFSGRDGRTTIFDYWSLKSLRDWINDGAFDGAGLTDAQRRLRAHYQQILTIAQSEPAIVKGTFYDLTYANLDNPHFNAHRHYVFLRKHEDDVVMVVANFGDTAQTVRIRIPEEAFSALGIEDNRAARLTNLLTGKKSISTLTSACPFRLSPPAYSGCVMKFSYTGF